MLSVGRKFPQFKMKATVSTDMKKAFIDYSNEKLAGKWCVIFFYPKDFTFICPTEIKSFNDMREDFESRNCLVLTASTDSEFVHLAWRQHEPTLKNLSIPMLADIKKELTTELGILNESEGVAFRATFIVDPEGEIRHASMNDLSVGRNPKEVLRTLDALQTGGLCPCNWEKGQDTLNP